MVDYLYDRDHKVLAASVSIEKNSVAKSWIQICEDYYIIIMTGLERKRSNMQNI